MSSDSPLVLTLLTMPIQARRLRYPPRLVLPNPALLNGNKSFHIIGGCVKPDPQSN